MSKLGAKFAFCVCWLLALSASLQAADGGDYILHANASEVRVLFTAQDARGNRVTQLQPADVAVIDNSEVIRRFRSFSSASETPLHVVVLVDVSDSVRERIAGNLRLVSVLLRNDRWQAKDQVSVMTFGGADPKMLCHLNCRERSISFDARSVGSTTPLYDSLVTASELLARMHEDDNSRAAIILLSDGADNYSSHGLQGAISVMQAADVSVYTLNARATKSSAAGDVVLEQIAAETGGAAYVSGKDSTTALDAVIENLHQGFVLTYELPRSRSSRHEVRVVPALNSRLRFRCRQSYTEKSSAE